MEFKLHSEYQPTGDQPQAIKQLVAGFKEGARAGIEFAPESICLFPEEKE